MSIAVPNGVPANGLMRPCLPACLQVDGPGDAPVKRKRGRPRKHPLPNAPAPAGGRGGVPAAFASRGCKRSAELAASATAAAAAAAAAAAGGIPLALLYGAGGGLPAGGALQLPEGAALPTDAATLEQFQQHWLAGAAAAIAAAGAPGGAGLLLPPGGLPAAGAAQPAGQLGGTLHTPPHLRKTSHYR